MKKFCRCNGNWIMGARARHGQVAFDNTQENANIDWREYQAQYAVCPICEFWPWHDGQYENFMFDLKEMNRC